MGPALAAFESVIGAEHVVRDPAAVDLACKTTYASAARVQAILRPANLEQVRALVLAANEHGATLYPVSRGMNWGYGSRVPPLDCTAIVDLSRMDKILAYDEDLAYVTLQPGVSFATLASFLAERGGKHYGPVHGGPGDASVLGHALERGLGKGAYSERWLYACNFEIVLPNGQIVHTGFGRFANAACAPVTRVGPGPYVDGLFLQSNFGIVTEMTVWLAPVSKHTASCMFGVRTDAGLEGLVDAIRVLKLEGTLRSSSLLANDVRRLAFSRQYPWEETGGKTPLPRAVREKLSRGIAWSGDAALYSASAGQLAADKARIREVLGKAADFMVWSDEIDPATSPIPPEVVQTVHTLNLGKSLPRTVATTYWRKKGPLPETLDPDRDRCGFVSFSPAIPFQGKHARIAIDALHAILEEHGFDPNLGLNCVSERSIDLTPMIIYDRDVPGDDERADACHDAMLKKMASLGYHPYRLTAGAMDRLEPPRDEFVSFLGALKRAVDPNGVVAPGRYEFRTRK